LLSRTSPGCLVNLMLEGIVSGTEGSTSQGLGRAMRFGTGQQREYPIWTSLVRGRSACQGFAY
ncbi:MAG: hypothetical protein VCB43_15095, partial [Myxococcota bacterium]